MAIIVNKVSEFDVVYYDTDAKKKTETFKTEKEAKKFKKSVDNLYKKVLDTTEDMLFADYLLQYLECIENVNVVKKTESKKYGIFNNYIAPNIKGLKIKDINSTSLNKVLSDINNTQTVESVKIKGESTLTKNLYYQCFNIIKRSVDYLYINGMICNNPLAAIKIPKGANKGKGTNWTFELFEETLSKCDDRHLFVFLHLMMYTGLSIRDLLALQVKDLNISNEDVENNKCSIEVNNTFIRSEPEYIKSKKIDVKHTFFKDSRSQLYLIAKEKPLNIYIPVNIATIVADLVLINRTIYNHSKSPFNFLFSLEEGNPMDESTINKRFDAIKPSENHTLSGLNSLGRQPTHQTVGQRYYENKELNLPNFKPISFKLQGYFTTDKSRSDFQDKLDAILPKEEDINLDEFIDLLTDNEDFCDAILALFGEENDDGDD